VNAAEMTARLGQSIGLPDLGDRLYDFVNLGQKKLEALTWWRHLEVFPPHQLVTVAPYTTGTIAVTNGSSSVVGTGTAWTTALHGNQVLKVSGDSNWYFISSVGSTTGITLATKYVGTTAAAATYSIYTVRFPLPSDIAMWKVKSVIVQNPHRVLDYIDEDELNELRPDMLVTTGQPVRYTDVGDNLQFDPVADAAYVVTVRYQRSARVVSSAQTVLDWHVDLHEALLKFGIAEGWRDRGDDQADDVEAEAVRMAQDLVSQNNKKAGNYSRLKPFDARGGRSKYLRNGVRVTGDGASV
jgi:hypothetical protein